MGLEQAVSSADKLFVKQRKELAEFFGYETRNKYEILSIEGDSIGFAAEQQKGVGAFFARQFLGHWRPFSISIFDIDRRQVLSAVHPFRFFFQCFEVHGPHGEKIGTLEQRFSVLSRRFDVLDAAGSLLMTMNSPLLKLWTYPFLKDGAEAGCVRKKWSGLQEIVLDADNFVVELGPQLTVSERWLVLAAALFIDLKYFERKAGS
jgi:hypothetical protein